MNRNRQRRHLSIAEKRGLSIIRGEAVDVDRLLRKKGHARAYNTVSFTLQRSVLEGSFFDGRDLRRYISDSKVKGVGALSLSLFSPRESRVLLHIFSESSSDLRTALGESAQTRPDELKGHLGKAVIVGAGMNKPGIRYVGVALQSPLNEEVIEERGEVGRELGLEARPALPHISFAKTDDQMKAEVLMNQINDAELTLGVPVTLGPLATRPIRLNGNAPDFIARR